MSKTPTFTEIFARIDEASKSKTQLDELFGGFGGALKRKALNAVNPTAQGQGRRIVDTQAKNVLTAWQKYVGTSGVPNSATALHNWIKNILGEKNDSIWKGAVGSFCELYPKSGSKFIKGTILLDSMEILNFLVEYIKARNAANSTDEANKDNDTTKTQETPKSPEEQAVDDNYGVAPIAQKEYTPMKHPFPNDKTKQTA